MPVPGRLCQLAFDKPTTSVPARSEAPSADTGQADEPPAQAGGVRAGDPDVLEKRQALSECDSGPPATVSINVGSYTRQRSDSIVPAQHDEISGPGRESDLAKTVSVLDGYRPAPMATARHHRCTAAAGWSGLVEPGSEGGLAGGDYERGIRERF